MTNELRDLAARAGWTAGQAFLAVYTVEGGSEVTKAAAIAAVGALLSVIKTYVNGKRASN